MPIYEFHCEKCGGDNEILVRTTDWKGTACPACGSKRLSKKLSVFASSATGAAEPASDCTGVQSSCGRCRAAVPHKHHHY